MARALPSASNGVAWSYILAGVLAFTFFFFITSRGELPKYLALVGL